MKRVLVSLVYNRHSFDLNKAWFNLLHAPYAHHAQLTPYTLHLTPTECLTCSRTCHSTCLHRTCSSPPACTAWRKGCPHTSHPVRTERWLCCSEDGPISLVKVSTWLSYLGSWPSLTPVCCCVLLIHWPQDQSRHHLYGSLLKCVNGHSNAITLQGKLSLSVKLLEPLNNWWWVT